MQRRTAAMYVVFFLVIAVGAIAFINVVEAPSPSMDEYDFQLQVDDNVTIGDTTYQVTRIDVFSATLAWTESEVEQSDNLDNESTIESEGTEYRIEIDPGEDPEGFVLHETFPEHDLDTVEVEGVTYVVIEENNETTFIPEQEYLLDEYGPREQVRLTVGDSFYLDAVDASVSVEEITSEMVSVTWVGPDEQTMTIQRGEPTEIGGTTFVTNFVGTEYIQLTTDLDAYEEHQNALDTYDERHLGFWGVGVLSMITAILIGALSYLPRRR